MGHLGPFPSLAQTATVAAGLLLLLLISSAYCYAAKVCLCCAVLTTRDDALESNRIESDRMDEICIYNQ